MSAPQIILGVDPGLVNTGWGIITRDGANLKFVACGTIVTSAKAEMPERLRQINKNLKEVLESYTIDSAAVEEIFVNTNNLTSLKLGHARGAIILTLSLADISVSEYSAKNVKKAVVGTGGAQKEQVGMMIKVLLPKATVKSEHEADALAVAICHANTHRWG
jgi:crossover junction endodeoxyribonuclease RuvC